MLIINAFSANMLVSFPTSVHFEEIPEARARGIAQDCVSAVGHADTAAVFSTLLGVTVPMARTTVALREGDTALLGQYSGPRLPEGSTTLPAGATIRWILVAVG